MALIKCKNCNGEVSSMAKKCPHCGTSLVPNKGIICSECGNKIKDGATVCDKCGCPVHQEKKMAETAKEKIYGSLDKLTGAKVKNYVSVKDLFKNTFKKHSQDDLDEVFVCGSKNTTPKPKDIDLKKASAWVYFRVFIFFLISFAVMYVGYVDYQNDNFLPGLIFIGGFAVPITVLIFFFEINLFRNIPFYKVIKYFVLGGCFSLIVAILYFSIFTVGELDYFGALMVGLIEEVAKAIVVVFFLFREKRSNYILDGLLIGAAVGAGFAAFETAGYILRYGLQYNFATMLEVLKLRAILAPGGHVAWAAIEGAALMYVKGINGRLKKEHINNKTFLLICLIPTILHGIWDMPINIPYNLLQIGLTIAAWVVVIYFINLGLKQVDDAKKQEK